MTQEEKRIAIYEALGWKRAFNGDHEDPEWYWIDPSDPDSGFDECPDIFNDRNAFDDAWGKLSMQQRCLYLARLMVLKEIEPQPTLWGHAQACFVDLESEQSDRAEALYLTLCNKQ